MTAQRLAALPFLHQKAVDPLIDGEADRIHPEHSDLQGQEAVRPRSNIVIALAVASLVGAF